MRTKNGPRWFGGQVNLADRMIGLEAISGDTVLDLGCAEGMVSQSLVARGATVAHGFDRDSGRVSYGNSITTDGIELFVADLNKPPPPPLPHYDVVLMLAILQKLKRPEDLIKYAAGLASDWLAVRTPYRSIYDARSGYRHLDTTALITQEKFHLVSEIYEPVWVGVFRRDH